MTQSKLRSPLRIWFEKRRITTYEQAEKALREVGLSMGTREEVAPHLPSPSDKVVTPSHSSAPAVSSNARSVKKVQRKSSKKRQNQRPKRRLTPLQRARLLKVLKKRRLEEKERAESHEQEAPD